MIDGFDVTIAPIFVFDAQVNLMKCGRPTCGSGQVY